MWAYAPPYIIFFPFLAFCLASRPQLRCPRSWGRANICTTSCLGLMHMFQSRIPHTMTAGARARMQTSDIHTGVLFNLDLERTERAYAVCSPQSTHLRIFAYTRRCLLFVHEATNLRSLCAPILTPFTCDLNTLLIQHAFPTLVCVLLFQGCW